MVQVTSRDKYQHMGEILNEKQWRQFLALEAKEKGEVATVALEAGVSRNTVYRGIDEIESGDVYRPGERIRMAGGGRKKISDSDTSLISDLENLIHTKGNPMKYILYTTKSVAKLTDALVQMGHAIADSTIERLLHSLHYSLKPNKKNIEGVSHADRDLQFNHIDQQCKLFEKEHNPIISIDCKKKEQLGNFKNNGREWTKKGKEHETNVNAYDFTSLADGHIAPYGIYDVLKKKGFVNVGIDHDTATFAVESIRRWWKGYGKTLYPHATGILITADGGGSNGVRNRLFKKELQKLKLVFPLRCAIIHQQLPNGM